MTAAANPVGLFGLLRAAGSLEALIESQLAAVGLSIPKLAALQRLVDAGDVLPLGQLADKLACVKSNVTQLVDRLEAEGFVARVPDPDDKRSRLAVITDAGRQAHREGARIRGDAEGHLLSCLSPSEVDVLGEIIQKLRTAQAGFSCPEQLAHKPHE